MPKEVALPKSLQVSKEEEKFRERNAAEIESKAEDIKRPCTKCKIGLFAKDVKVHPVLGVTFCAKCLGFYKSGSFEVDDDGDPIFCTWCGNGGNLIFCSTCKIAAFCKVCIRSNLGNDALKETESDDWICYYCNSKPIWKLRAYCHATVLRIEKRKKDKLPINMLRLSQLNKSMESNTAESEEEEEMPSPLKRRNKSFVAKDHEDPHAEPESSEDTEEDVEDARRYSWAKKKKKKKSQFIAECYSSDDERVEQVPKVKIKRLHKNRRRNSNSDFKQSKHASEHVEKRSKPKKRRSSESDEEEDEELPRKSKSGRNIDEKSQDSNNSNYKSNSGRSSSESEGGRPEKKKSKKLKKTLKESKPGCSNQSDSRKTKMFYEQAMPSTSFASNSYALDSSDEHYCSSANEQELTLEWLADSLKSFEVFISKNKEFHRTINQQFQSLDNKSTIEKVTEVSKKVHKHLNKCLSALNSHKEDLKREYSEWCNKYIDKISDEEIGENHGASSSNKDENRSKGDKKKREREAEAAESRTEADPKEKKHTKKKSKDEEDVGESRTAEPSGKKSSKKIVREEEDKEESRPEPETNEKSRGEEEDEPKTGGETSGKKSSKKTIREGQEAEKSRTDAELVKKKKKKKRDKNENDVGEPLAQSTPSFPARIKPAERQVVLESDEAGIDFDTNTLLMETPHSNDEADDSFNKESSNVTPSKSNVVVDSDSTSDLFSDHMEVDEAPGLHEEHSPDNNFAKKNISDKDPVGTSLKGEGEKSCAVPKTIVGKRPGPASKTCGSVASPVASEDHDLEVEKQPSSVTGSQATHFTEEEYEIQLREKQALDELLKSSDDSESELFKKPVVSTKPKKPAALRKISKLFVPSNSDEFAHITQLHQKCVVRLTRCDQTAKLKKRGSKRRRDSDADIDKLCNLEELENPSPTGKSKKRSQRKKSKAKKNKVFSDSDDSSGSDQESEAQDDDVPNLKASPTIDEFKLVDKEEEAKRALLQDSDSDEPSGSGNEDSKEKVKKKKKSLRKKPIISSDDSNSKNTDWKKDKLLNERLGISSSSENEKEKGGKAKKKRRTILDSDYSEGDMDVKEDEVIELDDSSDDFVSTKKKKLKRKRQSTSSEASVESESDTSDSEDDLFTETKKKTNKKRRVFLKDSSSSDCEEVEKKDNSPKKTRKIKRNSELEVATQDAAKQEKERLKRHSELQKMYNKIIEERGQDANVSELVLEFDPKTKEPRVEVHKEIATKLKPHQVKGIKFLWNTVFETVERTNTTDGSGCILAHCMGLGKTLQIVSIVHTILTHPEIELKTVIVVTPLTTVENWKNEFAMWTRNINDGEDLVIYDLSSTKKATDRKYVLRTWQQKGGILVISYDLYRNLANPIQKSKNKETRAAIADYQKALVNPGPDVIICDEGHVLKNEDKKLSVAMSNIRSKRRIILTGTPLQNSLIEYHCMMQFVKPNFLGNRKEFTNRFVNPIKEGQHKESTAMAVKIMKKRACVLHKMLEPSVQRFDYSVLKPHLQEKFEYVIKVRLTELQIKLYSLYLENCAKIREDQAVKRGVCLFADYQNLLRVWNHPYALLIRAQQDEDNEDAGSDSAGSLKDFIADGSTSESDASSSDGPSSKRTTRNDVQNGHELEETTGTCFINTWWRKTVTNEELNLLTAGNKMVLLFSILKECVTIGDKLLVFSQSLYLLDLIEFFLEKVSDASDEEREEFYCGLPGSFISGINYFRIDGKTSVTNRFNFIKKFNNPNNLKPKLFLVSTRAGGLGVNMVGANRVVLFDASWNPSNDMQSIFRVYRFGQTKPCYIYRFLAAGTMEEKIYDRQVTKLALSGRVVDKHTIDRHYTQADLEELYSFEPYRENSKTMTFPKDRLLADIYQKHKILLEEYFEHDSLLEDRPDENLTEEEQKAAWDEFENEKDLMAQRKKEAAEDYRRRQLLEQQMINMRNQNHQGQNQLNSEMLNALMSVPNLNANAIQYAQLLQQMAAGGLQMQLNNAARAPAYQGQLQQARVQNHAMTNELNAAQNMMNQLNRFMPNAAAANMPMPNLGGINVAQNSRAPYAVPQTAPSAGTSIAPVVVPDDDDEIIPVPSTSADAAAGAAKLKVRNDLFKK